MKNRILFTLAFALVTSQAYSMSPQQRADKLRQDETNRATIKANINAIEKSDNFGQINQLNVETQKLINNTPRGVKEFQGNLDNAVAKGERNVLTSIQNNLRNIKVGAQAPAQKQDARYSSLVAVTEFANQQRPAIQNLASITRFNGGRTIDSIMGMPFFPREAVNFMTAVNGNYFDINKTEFQDLSNAIKDSIVDVLIKDGINKIDTDFINKFKPQLKLELSSARNSILAYKNMLISTYVKPMVGKDNSVAKSFKSKVLNLTKQLMNKAENKSLITQADMEKFNTEYNRLK